MKKYINRNVVLVYIKGGRFLQKKFNFCLFYLTEMKFSIIYWLCLIVTAVILCRIFPIIEHDPITYLIFVFIITRFWKFIIFKKVPREWTFRNGEVSVITGSSCGIGRQIAEQLCSKGSKVVWAARDTSKAQKALNDLTWTDTFGPRGYVLRVDLASLESIAQFVQEFKKRENKLNLLILNAAYHGPYRTTSDGFEQTIGVNHLGHMYLCYLLLDMLKSSAPSRIVVVSSDLHRLCGDARMHDLMFAEKNSYGPWPAYNRSKLFNLLFVRELSRRLEGTNVTIHAAHPGTPVSTELTRDSVLSSVLIGQFIIRPLAYFYCRTTAEAAQTPLYTALDPKCATQSGLYFENCRVAGTSRLAQEDSLALELWNESCRLLNIDKNWI